MKKKYSWIIGIVIVLGIILIYVNVNNQKTSTIPCDWVYKTNEDYFNLINANLGSDEDGNEVIAIIPGGMLKDKLENGYIHEIRGCSKTLGWVKPANVAFLNKTVQEWLQEDVACTDEMQNKLNQLRIQKCGSLNFDIFEECSTIPTTTGEYECSFSGAPGPEIKTPTKCTYNMTREESNHISSCEGHKYSIDMVIDRNPFTELYFCQVGGIVEINEVIRNNQLDTECEKII